jgi:hypothetical protein
MILPRTDEILGEIKWPQLERIQPALEENDTLITCAGFEDRALKFLSEAVDTNSRGFRVVGIDYRPEVAENRVAELCSLATHAGASMKLVTYERQEPECLKEILDQVMDAKRIFVDISGMSRLLIVQLVAAGVRERLLQRMSIIYTEAQAYPPTRQEVEEKLADEKDYLGILNFISSGVFGITIVPELSTVAMQGQPIRLVAFPSFNPTQFAAVCAEIQASFFAIVNGVPPRGENSWRRDAIRKLNNIDSIKEKEEFDASTLDYRETLRLLLDLYKRHGAVEKLVISPTGSKMQAVAVGIVCGFLRDIQVVYPTPRSFPSPSSYTTGAIATYRLSLAPFSGLASRSGEVSEDETT